MKKSQLLVVNSYLLVSLIAALNHCCNLFALFLNGTLRGVTVSICITVHSHFSSECGLRKRETGRKMNRVSTRTVKVVVTKYIKSVWANFAGVE